MVIQVPTAENSDTQFLCEMAFLTDITFHLNHLNTLLQGRDQTVCNLYGHMTAYRRKLDLFIEGFSSPHLNLVHFPACEKMRKDVPECEKLIQKYEANIKKLQEQFNDRFQDFHVMQHSRAPSLLLSVSNHQNCSLNFVSCSQIHFFKLSTMRGAFYFGNCYQRHVFHSSGILLSQWPVCLEALTFVRALFQ